MNAKLNNSIRNSMVLLGVLALGTLVYASSVHLKGGKNAEPTFTDNGPDELSITAEGELAGLGDGDVIVEVIAEANVTSTCTNQGGNQAPGQNPAPITVTGSEPIPKEEIKNGNTPFMVTTEPVDPIIADAPDCPNSNWTEAIEDLAYTEATIIVKQDGQVVLELECVIDPPSADGTISKNDVECSEVE